MRRALRSEASLKRREAAGESGMTEGSTEGTKLGPFRTTYVKKHAHTTKLEGGEEGEEGEEGEDGADGEEREGRSISADTSTKTSREEAKVRVTKASKERAQLVTGTVLKMWRSLICAVTMERPLTRSAARQLTASSHFSRCEERRKPDASP